MRHLAFQDQRAFLVGFVAGFLLVAVKVVAILPVDIDDLVLWNESIVHADYDF